MLAGFSELAIQPQEVKKINRLGLSIADMKFMAEDHGVTISRLDPLCSWNPDWHPINMDNTFISEHSITAHDFFLMCEELGCSHMSLNAQFPQDRYSFKQQVEHYAEICRLANEYALVCDLEPIPMWGVRTLQQGWDIVREADAANGGLVFDTLHFVRSHSTLDVLRTIPGEKIHCVQICDGLLPLAEGVTLEQDCFNRMWPGTGHFPLAEIVSVLEHIGGLNQVGPEVFSLSNQSMSAEQIAHACRSSLANYPELNQ